MRELVVRGPCLIITVGPAASGKSTHLRRLAEADLIDVVISTDAVRAELLLAADETEVTYREARRRVMAALLDGRVVAVDATHVRPGDRAAMRHLAAAAGDAPVIVVRTAEGLSLTDLIARDAGRPRHVPAEVIAEQLHLYRSTASRELLAAEGYAAVVDAGTVTIRRVDPVPAVAPPVGTGLAASA